MRLYLVIDETCFYQQNFVARFLERTRDEVVGAALVTKIFPKNNLYLYLLTHWYYLKLSEIKKLTLHYLQATLFNLFSPKHEGGNFYSVKSVFKFFDVDFIEVHFDINQKKYIEHIKSKSPDVLISSNSLYFREEILKIPTICCINRHSSLLPSYGGLFPVFQAYGHGERRTGVSVHKMNPKIDGGEILSQREIPITPSDTIADIYEQCFKISADVVLDALEKVGKADIPPIKNNYKASYYSFPRGSDWIAFRKRRGRFA